MVQQSVSGIYLNKATNRVRRVSATPIEPSAEWTRVSDDPMLGILAIRKLIAEGTPSELRATLNGRILELRGQPISLLRKVAHQDEDVEDVQAFGDRLHVRVGEDKWPLVSDVYESHFAGRFTEQMQWLGFCLQVNYADFLGGKGLSILDRFSLDKSK